MRYRKKPVVIEAFQMTRERRWDNEDWPAWLNKAWQLEAGAEGALYPDPDEPVPDDQKSQEELCIGTLEGKLQITWGDFIIKGVKGELYPCKPDIFEATYDAVEAESEELESGDEEDPFVDAHAQFERVQAKACDETDAITPFNRAIGAILGEREYQERLWGPTEMKGRHNVTEFLVFIQDYVTEALHIQCRIASPTAENKTRHSMRKIAALAVACMEQNGVASRNIIDLQTHREKHCASG